MWTTSDGHDLGIRRSRFLSIASQLRRPELNELVRQNYRGNLKEAVGRAVGQLAKNAHRIGNLRHRQSTRRYPVFRARLDGQDYNLVTSPIDDTQSAILSIGAGETREEFEAAAKSGVAATISWTAPLRLREVKDKSPGIYIIEKNGDPLYVGEAADLARRWSVNDRFETIPHLGLSIDFFNQLIDNYAHGPYRLRLGTWPEASQKSRRLDVEYVLIRHLYRLAFKVPLSDATVKNLDAGQMPDILSRRFGEFGLVPGRATITQGRQGAIWTIQFSGTAGPREFRVDKGTKSILVLKTPGYWLKNKSSFRAFPLRGDIKVMNTGSRPKYLLEMITSPKGATKFELDDSLLLGSAFDSHHAER